MFCENKEKVELDCNGKCHLAKQLKTSKTSSEDSNAIISIADVLSVVFLEIAFSIDISKFTEKLKKTSTINYQSLYAFNFQSKHFKPPRVATV